MSARVQSIPYTRGRDLGHKEREMGKKKRNKFSRGWHGGAVELKGQSPEKTKERVLEAYKENATAPHGRRVGDFKVTQDYIDRIPQQFEDLNNEFQSLPASIIRGANIAQPDTDEEADGSGRNRVAILGFVKEHPIGSTLTVPDGPTHTRLEPGKDYTVNGDSIYYGGRFLDDILKRAGNAEKSKNQLSKNPDTPIYNNIFSLNGASFQSLPEAEQENHKQMWDFWSKLGKQLAEPGLFKRLLMDGQQAQEFANAPAGPDEERLQLLHPPFKRFYMEFTKPVRVGEQQPLPDGTTANDELVAITYRAMNPETWMKDLDTDRIPGIYETALATSGILFDDHMPPKTYAQFEAGLLSFIFRNPVTTEVCDRNFTMSMTLGSAITRYVNTQEGVCPEDPSIFPELYWERWREQLSKDKQRYMGEGKPEDKRWEDNVWINVGTNDPTTTRGPRNIPGRYAGYWERIINKYTEFFSWVMLYTVAKGIEIVEEPLPRHERRRMARADQKGEVIPEPWQIVRVEPTLRKKYENASRSGDAPKSKHGYRYDVRGHLRNGKHKLRDGSYKYSVEWVPAHQRGLKNELYIPKTHSYEGDMDEKLIPNP